LYHGYWKAIVSRVVRGDRSSADTTHYHPRRYHPCWAMLFWGEARRACEYANLLVSYDVGDKGKQEHERDGDVKLQTIGRGHSLSRGLWVIAFLFILAMAGGLATLLVFGHGDVKLQTIGRGHRLSRGLWAIAFLFILAMAGGLAALLVFVFGHGDDPAILGRGEIHPSVVGSFRAEQSPLISK